MKNEMRCCIVPTSSSKKERRPWRDGARLFAAGDTVGAMTEFAFCLKRAGADAHRLLGARATCNALRGLWDAVLDDASSAVLMCPTYAEGHLLVARALRVLGHPPHAVTVATNEVFGAAENLIVFYVRVRPQRKHSHLVLLVLHASALLGEETVHVVGVRPGRTLLGNDDGYRSPQPVVQGIAYYTSCDDGTETENSLHLSWHFDSFIIIFKRNAFISVLLLFIPALMYVYASAPAPGSTSLGPWAPEKHL